MNSFLTFAPAATAGGMEIDAFVVRNASIHVLRKMGTLLFLSTAPPSGMDDVDFDVLLCSGSGAMITCKVPGVANRAANIQNFVRRLCSLVSVRLKAVCMPDERSLKEGKRAFVCRRSRCIPSGVLFEILQFMGVTRISICMYGMQSSFVILALDVQYLYQTNPLRYYYRLAGLGVRLEDAHLYPFLTLPYGSSEGHLGEDDGLGDTTIRIDFSNTYRFKGLWNVCGYDVAESSMKCFLPCLAQSKRTT